jgi:SAM-dependent methyltransferase
MRPTETAAPLGLYSELAGWWPLLSPPEEYVEEAAFYTRELLRASGGQARTLLELGSGGGNNAVHMKAHFEPVLVDLSAEMLVVSRTLNPECEHHVGDMRTVRLERSFDAVFVHDAIVYMLTEADLRAVFDTAFAHCRPGGVALFAPDFVRENFHEGTDCGGSDALDGRGLRYLEWIRDPDPSDTTYAVDFAFLVRESDGTVRSTAERHLEGLFPRDTWLRLLSEAGFRAEVVHADHSPGESAGQEVFVAVRPE